MTVELQVKLIADLTNSASVTFDETVQSLWSGYGVIAKMTLIGQGGGQTPVVVKYVSPPENQTHKYGWQGEVSHQRKLDSYQNEFNWYSQSLEKSQLRQFQCRLPKLLASDQTKPNWLLVLEDLDAAGYPIRLSRVNDQQLESCISWLANLHAAFVFDSRETKFSNAPTAKLGLWPIGTYWHLATRPDEFATMPNGELKQCANKIDAALSNARFQSIVHGDAKLANFCFAADDRVAAVDFQYVGGGCGMKDLAYFVSSCFDEGECERRESDLLDLYFDLFHAATTRSGVPAAQRNAAELEKEWRSLYRVAWADFYRFLSGWSPGHWKMHSYSQYVAEEVCHQILAD